MAVAPLAVDDPDTDDPDTDGDGEGDGTGNPLFCCKTGEYAGKSSLTTLDGDPTNPGGLKLSPILRPVLSLPRPPSLTPLPVFTTAPTLLPSRSLTPLYEPYPPPTPRPLPVGEIDPKGEFVPRLDLDPERSHSDEEFRVELRPRLSDLESLAPDDNEYEPVVVDPLVGEHPPVTGERPRPPPMTSPTSLGDR